VTVNNIVILIHKCLLVELTGGFGRELSRYGILGSVNINSARFYDPACSPTPYRIILTNKQTK
jgi:hypothetical protein